MTYQEHILGVPFAYVTRGRIERRTPGPYLFMARLYLDNLLATLGGVLYWGFAKQLADLVVARDRFSIARRSERLISLQFQPCGDFAPPQSFPHFEAMRRIMSQPLVSQLPLALGPFFACSDFDRQVEDGEMRALTTVVEIEEQFVQGLPCGRFPAGERAPGIDTSALGSYEIRCPWRQSMIYPAFPRSPSHDE